MYFLVGKGLPVIRKHRPGCRQLPVLGVKEEIVEPML